jgi:hypothetical protein
MIVLLIEFDVGRCEFPGRVKGVRVTVVERTRKKLQRARLTVEMRLREKITPHFPAMR